MMNNKQTLNLNEALKEIINVVKSINESDPVEFESISQKIQKLLDDKSKLEIDLRRAKKELAFYKSTAEKNSPRKIKIKSEEIKADIKKQIPAEIKDTMILTAQQENLKKNETQDINKSFHPKLEENKDNIKVGKKEEKMALKERKSLTFKESGMLKSPKSPKSKEESESTSTRSEIDIKILIEKESFIKKLQMGYEEIKRENSELKERLFMEKKSVEVPKNEITLNTNSKSSCNQTDKKMQKVTKEAVIEKRKNEAKKAGKNTILTIKGINEDSLIEKVKNEAKTEIKKIEKNRVSEIEKIRIKENRETNKKVEENSSFISKKNEMLKDRVEVLRRSQSEPKQYRDALMDFSTPKRGKDPKRKLDYMGCVDDAVLSTIKFKKTKSLFQNQPKWKFDNTEVRNFIAKESLLGEKASFKSSNLSNRLSEALLVLSDKNELWQERVKSMVTIEEIVKKRAKISKDQLNILKNVLVIQINDLRSAIIKQVCKTLSFLSQEIPKDIFFFFGEYSNALFGRVYNSIRAIREPCSECVKQLVQNISDARCAKELLQFIMDSHPEVRKLAIEMIGYCIKLSINQTENKIDKYNHQIGYAIQKLISDANNDVRKAAKISFEAFSQKWPDRASKLFDELKPSSKKLIKINF